MIINSFCHLISPKKNKIQRYRQTLTKKFTSEDFKIATEIFFKIRDEDIKNLKISLYLFFRKEINYRKELEKERIDLFQTNETITQYFSLIDKKSLGKIDFKAYFIKFIFKNFKVYG